MDIVYEVDIVYGVYGPWIHAARGPQRTLEAYIEKHVTGSITQPRANIVLDRYIEIY